jgi:DNA-binding NarL/FixJ family response regulator
MIAAGPDARDADGVDLGALDDAVRPVRVLIVDDQEPYRMAARTVVQVTPGFVLVGEAGSGEAGLRAAAELAPDLVLMDINMPGLDGFEATRRLTSESSPPVVILMSTYAADALPTSAHDVGAARYVHKEDLGPDVLLDVWRVASASGPTPRAVS